MRRPRTTLIAASHAAAVALALPGTAGAGLVSQPPDGLWSVEVDGSSGEARAIDVGGRLFAREFRAAAWWREAVGGVLEGRLLHEADALGPLAATADLGMGWRLASSRGATVDLVAAARWTALESPERMGRLGRTEDPVPVTAVRLRAEVERGLGIEASAEIGDGGAAAFWGCRAGVAVDLDGGWVLRADAGIRRDAEALDRTLSREGEPADRVGFWMTLSKSF